MSKNEKYAKIVSDIRIAACGAEKPSSRLLLMQLAADAIEELLANNTEAFPADIISMKTAVETDVWLMVWAVEPNRKIHVKMTYDELWKIVQMERENMIEPPKED